MPRPVVAYVNFVEALNYRIGRMAMYVLFLMMAILLWSSVSKTFFTPSLWTLEMAQFAMVAYFLLGGPYSIQLGSNVRMDLFYHTWTPRRKALVDAFTVFFLIFYLCVLFYGAIGSAAYSLGHFGAEPFAFFGQLVGGFFTGGPEGVAEVVGRVERSPTAWRPFLWPIKLVIMLGVLLMLLQALAELAKDIARVRGHELGERV